MKTSRAALTLASFLLSACVSGSLAPSGAGYVSATPSPDESTGEPGAAAEETPAPTAYSAGALARDGIAEVVTDDLVVRSLPEISARSIIAPVTLSRGKLLFVFDGPVATDGFEWYRVAPFDEFPSDIPSEAPRLGWVAAGRSGDLWIAPWTGECPEPTLEELLFRAPSLRLACFGDDELTLQGILGDCSYVVTGTVSPAWLANFFCRLVPFDFEADLIGGMLLRPGEVPESLGKGLAVRVIGHFDHPAAQTCVEDAPLPGEESTPPELVVLYCRTQFVATDFTKSTAP